MAVKYREAERRRRGKRKKNHFFLNILVAALVVVLLWFIAFRSGIFDVKTFEVQGAAHYTAAQVAELSGVKRGDNIWKTRVSEAEKLLESDPYIRSAEVSWALPDGLDIAIEERVESVAAHYAGGYAVLDFDGVVLRLSDTPPPLPEIAGLTVEDPAPGSALRPKEAGWLGPALEFIRFVSENDFYIKKLDVGGVVPRAYVFDKLVIEGELKNMESGIEELKRVIADLDSKGIVRGTISVGGRGTCSFTPEVRG